jgi:hypothetical protein
MSYKHFNSVSNILFLKMLSFKRNTENEVPVMQRTARNSFSASMVEFVLRLTTPIVHTLLLSPKTHVTFAYAVAERNWADSTDSTHSRVDCAK